MYLTYHKWSQYIEAFSNGDDNAINELKEADFELDAGTALRFYKKIECAYTSRKELWQDNFDKSIKTTRPKTDGELAILFRNAKSNLSPLINFISLKGIPSDLKEVLKNDLIKYISEIKKSIKENSIKNNRGNEKLLLVINTLELTENDFNKTNNLDLPPDTNNYPEESNNKPARRILL